MTAAWQLLRECPPGYGGVERVAHELADAWAQAGHSAVVFCLRPRDESSDPLEVNYRRVALPHWSFGRLLLPRPSGQVLQLLTASAPLHVHLPCPAVLLLALLARLLRPARPISVHWHSFLEPVPTPAGRWFGLYQWCADRALPCFERIITTSPVLKQELMALGASPASVRVLPCCLPLEAERRTPSPATVASAVLRVICVGRLDSYKRVDWLIAALAEAQRELKPGEPELHLDVVGDGPDRDSLCHLAADLAPGQVTLHGRLDEEAKWHLLSLSGLLVLPADRCHEAFGIVQLEAMSLGVPALAFAQKRSGTAWVSQLPSLPTPLQRSSLPGVLVRLARDPELLTQLRREALQRYRHCFSRTVWQKQFEAAFG